MDNENKQMTLPDPPSDWNELSKEQLIFIHSQDRSSMPDSIFKMKVFLELCGLELAGESYFYNPGENTSTTAGHQERTSRRTAGDKGEPSMAGQQDIKAIEKELEWAESVLSGTAPVMVVLKNKGEDDGVLMQITSDDLYDAIAYYTKFIDEPYTMIDHHLGEIFIGSHHYKTPDPLMTSLTYEQYTDSQSVMSRIGDCNQELSEIQKEIVKLVEKKREPDNEFIEEAERLSKELKEAQVEFVSYMLVPMEKKMISEPLYDEKGEPVMNDDGTQAVKTVFVSSSIKFDRAEDRRAYMENVAIPELRENMPEWLFPILYQWYQSCLIEQKKMFPKLFSGKKGSAESVTSPLLGTLSTLNTLMKEQGYKDQQAVLDANAVLNFHKLDAMTKQAEEMEKMNKDLKRKRK